MPSVQEAVTAYLAERGTELSDSSLQNHRYQLKQFTEWARGAGDVDNIDDVEPIDLSRFRRSRAKDINSNTMYNQLSVLRLFLRFCNRMSWVGEGVPDSIILPTRDGRSRDSSIDPDRVAAILDDLDQYAYASLDHVILALMWTCSMRIGAVRALDVCDVHTDEQWIDMVHRPGTDTPLKNKGGSEREINLHGWVAELLDAWMTDRRPGVRDAHGRDPLLVSDHGRLARSSIRSRVYRLTSCSDLSEACDCGDAPTACDDVVSPHDIRRYSISAWLDEGHDPQLLSGRDTSPETMDRHYDVRNATHKRELRRDAFDM